MAKVDENNYKKVIASTNDGLKRENEEDQRSLNYTLINRLITDAKETAWLLQKKTPKLQGVVNYTMYVGGGGGGKVNNFMLSISRSLQDHVGAKIPSKSAKFEPNSDIRSTYVLSRGKRVKHMQQFCACHFCTIEIHKSEASRSRTYCRQARSSRFFYSLKIMINI